MALRYSLLVLMLGLSALMVNGQTTTQKTTSQSSGQTTPNTTSAQLNATQKQCGENEIYTTCGSACPANCSHFNPPPACNKACAAGCFCKDGLLRDDSGKCIAQALCESCQGNTTYVSCGSQCPKSCIARKSGACILSCYIGCACKNNYVRQNGPKNDGPCVLAADCPKYNTKQ